jgi:adenylylsulfate kinase
MHHRSGNTFWQPTTVTRPQREQAHGHRAVVLWFTGLSGAGKSTLANAVEAELHRRGCSTLVLDGDNVRHGLCADLGFDVADRRENIRRVGELAKLMNEAGVMALTAFISPFRADRNRVRALLPEGDFIEIHCESPIEICEARDVKGLYARARNGEIADFTGISSPYEPPEAPELVVPTGSMPLENCVQRVFACLQTRGIIQAEPSGVRPAHGQQYTFDEFDDVIMRHAANG